MWEMCKWLESQNYLTKPILFTHDSLNFDCHPDEFIHVVHTLGTLLNEVPVRDFSTYVHSELTLGKSLGHEIETVIEVDGDPATATECILNLSGLKDEIYETIDNWRGAYDIEILDEWYNDKDEEGNTIKVQGYKSKLISYYDVFTNSRPYTNNYGTYEYSGNCRLKLKYRNR